jgi:hypothetical protein
MIELFSPSDLVLVTIASPLSYPLLLPIFLQAGTLFITTYYFELALDITYHFSFELALVNCHFFSDQQMDLLYPQQFLIS